MNSRIRFALAATTSVLLALGVDGSAWAQTNPPPQSLPFYEQFSGLAWTSTVYPTGWQGWDIGPAISFTFSTDPPTADRSLTALSSAASTLGGVRNYRGKLGLLSTGSLNVSLALALNTTGRSGVVVTYDIMTIRNIQDAMNTRVNEVTLQYRVGTVGPFTSLTGIEYQNLAGGANNQTGSDVTTPQNLVTKTAVLPAACDDKPEVQIRWVCRDVSGSGSRAGFAVDNVKIPVPGTHFIMATAGAGGTIDPAGLTVANDGSNRTYTMTPILGYSISDLNVDGASVGAVPSYTFNNVSGHHTIQASFTPTNPATGLAGRWRLNGDGSDASGNANHGTVVNTPEYVPGVEGQAPWLNGSLAPGSAQYVSAPDSPSLNITGPITLAAWIRPERAATQSIISKALIDATDGYELTCSSAGFVFVRFNQLTSGELFRLNSTTPYPTDGNTWMHVATTYDGTTIRLYINGVLSGNKAGPASIGSNTGGLGIGSQFDGSGGRDFRGAVDEVRVYSRALSPSEIAALAGLPTHTISASAGSGGTISPNGLVPVSPGADQTFTFTPSPGHHVTAVRVDAVPVAVAPSYTFVNVQGNRTIDVQFALDTVGGGALAFDGIGQYVTFGAAPELRASNFTIELWFKKTGTGATTHTGTGGVFAVPLITKGRGEEDGDNRDVNYFLGINAAGRLVADYEEGTGQTSPGLNHPVVGSAVIANNAWYHAAAVFDGFSLRLYLNGGLDGVTTGLAGRNPQSASIHNTTVATATNSAGTPEGFFAGEIDEPRIWGVALNQCELIGSMNAEVSSGTGLAGRWGLNEASGSTAGNSVAGSPNGNLVNGPGWVSGAQFDLTPPAVPSPAAPSDLVATTPAANQVRLTWTDNAMSETGFAIDRARVGGGPFAPLVTVGPDTTSYLDESVAGQTEYCYRIRALGCISDSDYAPAACVTTTVSIESGPVSELELSPVAPNPIHGRASFQFALPQASQVTLEVLDIQGRQLAILVDGERDAGRHEVAWNAQAGGHAVANGVYFLRFRGLGREITRRFVLLTR